MNKESIGIVKTKYFKIKDEIVLDSGKKLNDITVAYETYGELNKEKNNGILVCHAFSGDAHAAGWHEGDNKPGWWESLIGSGKALDTKKYFIICSNVLGGCKGTTGPSSINPETEKPYGIDFPVITIRDMVIVQEKLIRSLGIDKLIVIGGSMGGMQTLQWAITYPDMVKRVIPIATTARSTPQQIAFNEVGRQAITADPSWHNGQYYESGEIPKNGLSVARMVAHITYLSDESMYLKFGRDLQDKKEITYDLSMDFQVESYLHYQGESFVKRFDANSYLYITKAIDYFDLSLSGSLIDGLKNIKSKVQVVSIDSDWLYPTEQSMELVSALAANDIEVSFSELKSSFGHDAFFLEEGQLTYILTKFLEDYVVEDLMKEDVPTIKENAEIKDAAILMVNQQITHLPVITDENKLIGIVTSWDLSKSIASGCNGLKDVMTKNVKYCNATDTIESVAETMRKHEISSLPVVDESLNLKGLISMDQVSHLI